MIAAWTEVKSQAPDRQTSQPRQAPDGSQIVLTGHWLLLAHAVQVLSTQDGWVPAHSLQAPPAVPQALSLLPAWQAPLASQQPAQVWAQDGEGGGGEAECGWQVLPSQMPLQHWDAPPLVQAWPTGVQPQARLPLASVVTTSWQQWAQLRRLPLVPRGFLLGQR